MKHRGLVKLLEYTKYNFSPSKRKFKSTLVTFVDEIKAFVKSKTGKLNVLHVFAQKVIPKKLLQSTLESRLSFPRRVVFVQTKRRLPPLTFNSHELARTQRKVGLKKLLLSS